TEETQFVFRRLEEAIRIFGREFDAHWVWPALLVPITLAALAYVIWMYSREIRTIGIAWALPLAGLRTLVCLILATVFLLPAIQTWEKSETHPKLVVLMDVSGSMGSKDDLPRENLSIDKLPTRRDKVIRLLRESRTTFLQELEKTSPVYLYRFGN